MKYLWPTMVTWGAYSCEDAYMTYSDMMGAVMPLHGGRIRADGSWYQSPAWIDAPFSLSLPDLARERGQEYLVGLASYSGAEWMAFLDNPGIWTNAINGLLSLIDSRFDTPWDGVLFAFEKAASTYQLQTTDFLSQLAAAVQGAGMLAVMAVRGRTGDTGPDYDDAYTYDFAALGAVMDKINYNIWSYWAPPPRSIWPFWWVNDCLRYATEDCAIPAEKLIVNLGGFSWWLTSAGPRIELSYAEAMQMIEDVGGTIEWVEDSVNGAVRERRSVLPLGTMWVHEGDACNSRLALLDRYGITGASMFTPALAAPSMWDAIAAWMRPPAIGPRRRASRRARKTNWREFVK